VPVLPSLILLTMNGLRELPLREVSNLVPIWQYIYVSFFLIKSSLNNAAKRGVLTL